MSDPFQVFELLAIKKTFGDAVKFRNPTNLFNIDTNFGIKRESIDHDLAGMRQIKP